MNVDDLVQQQIAAARRRAEATKRQRAELAAARQHGIAARHRAKLARLDTQTTGTEQAPDSAEYETL